MTALLVVDDEPAVCAVVREVAESLGYRVAVANSGEEFKSAFADTAPQVIVLDLAIPGTDGLELLKFLAGQGTRARILILSGFDQNYLKMALDLGSAYGLAMAGSLAKPLRVGELRQVLGRLTGEARSDA